MNGLLAEERADHANIAVLAGSAKVKPSTARTALQELERDARRAQPQKRRARPMSLDMIRAMGIEINYVSKNA